MYVCLHTYIFMQLNTQSSRSNKWQTLVISTHVSLFINIFVNARKILKIIKFLKIILVLSKYSIQLIAFYMNFIKIIDFLEYQNR